MAAAILLFRNHWAQQDSTPGIFERLHGAYEEKPGLTPELVANARAVIYVEHTPSGCGGMYFFSGPELQMHPRMLEVAPHNHEHAQQLVQKNSPAKSWKRTTCPDDPRISIFTETNFTASDDARISGLVRLVKP